MYAMPGDPITEAHVTALACLQASSMSKEAAESAQHRLRGLDAPYVQALAPKEPEKPSAAVLAQYGITLEFMDFVRSLTYSTFRDFPADALPTAKVMEPKPAFQHCQSHVSYIAAPAGLLT